MTGNKQQDRARAEVTFIGKTCWRSSYGVLLEKNMESQKRTRQLHVKKYIIQAHLHDVSASVIINT